MNNLVSSSPISPRQGREEAFKEMHKQDDDKLLIDDVFEDEVFED